MEINEFLEWIKLNGLTFYKQYNDIYVISYGSSHHIIRLYEIKNYINEDLLNVILHKIKNN